MKTIKLTDTLKKWFTWTIKFTCEWLDFWLIKIKKPLGIEISAYVFLFRIMEDQFKDQPELNIPKFWQIFWNSMEVHGKEKTEKNIMKTFWKKFITKIYNYER